MLSIILNLYCSVNLYADPDIITLRIIEATLILVMFLKALYYLRLISQLAPLIGIMGQIFSDIVWFLFIFVFLQIAFIFAYRSIGLN